VWIVRRAAARALLESGSRRHTTAQALAQRSRIVLLVADGLRPGEVAERLGVHRNTVAKWRRRFEAERLDGLVDEPRPGQPRTVTDAMVDEVITKTLESAPKNATHWSTRSMAAEIGLTQSAVHRIWKAFGLQPHRAERFCPILCVWSRVTDRSVEGQRGHSVDRHDPGRRAVEGSVRAAAQAVASRQ
jgi:transposase